jgi:phage tail sheath protein FI
LALGRNAACSSLFFCGKGFGLLARPTLLSLKFFSQPAALPVSLREDLQAAPPHEFNRRTWLISLIKSPKYPGVYIKEENAFPDSVVAVATAVPAFIGYTQRAEHKGKSCLHEAVRISSFRDFLTFFGALTAAGEAAPGREQYTPVYIPVISAKGSGEISLAGKAYDLLPDPDTIFYLYNSLRLFYLNGGADCYVVSVGLIGDPAGKPLAAAAPLVNPSVKYDDLRRGLDVIAKEAEPTMIVVPDALLLPKDEYGTLLCDILSQCGELGSRVGLLDIYHGEAPDPGKYEIDLADFRERVGTENLSYGAAYYPFLKTTVLDDSCINFVNLGGDKILSAILPMAGSEPLKTLLAQIAKLDEKGAPSSDQIEDGLRQASLDYRQLHDRLLATTNILPPSGAIAGVYTAVDNNRGVWVSPANVSLIGVRDVTLLITDQMQGPLKVDPVMGKSINAIRPFAGRGVMVWGARTLDGNGQDWRYVNVRRTMIMIEQSVKFALRAFVSEPNAAGTWSSVKQTLASFLRNLWSPGALAGAKPEEAFDVAVGLGETMTTEDIANGVMNVTIRLAVTHPGEFMFITVSQKMQTA